jgi:hypothetical protein
MTDSALIAGSIGAVLILVRVIERLVFDRKNSKFSGIDRESKDILIRLDKSHARTDADGTPLWYTPRRWGVTLENIHDGIRDSAEIQRKICKVQEEVLKEIKNSNGGGTR